MTLPAGVHFETYAQDRALIRTRGQWAWFALFMFALVVLPFSGSGRLLGTAIVIGITVIAVVGL